MLILVILVAVGLLLKLGQRITVLVGERAALKQENMELRGSLQQFRLHATWRLEKLEEVLRRERQIRVTDEEWPQNTGYIADDVPAEILLTCRDLAREYCRLNDYELRYALESAIQSLLWTADYMKPKEANNLFKALTWHRDSESLPGVLAETLRQEILSRIQG
jgi:hypothetical protein